MEKSFILHWIGGKTETVKGYDIADACRKAGIGAEALVALDYYEEAGKPTQVAGKADCGCVHHARQGLACPHDLALAGIQHPRV